MQYARPSAEHRPPVRPAEKRHRVVGVVVVGIAAAARSCRLLRSCDAGSSLPGWPAGGLGRSRQSCGPKRACSESGHLGRGPRLRSFAASLGVSHDSCAPGAVHPSRLRERAHNGVSAARSCGEASRRARGLAHGNVLRVRLARVSAAPWPPSPQRLSRSRRRPQRTRLLQRWRCRQPPPPRLCSPRREAKRWRTALSQC